MLSGPRAYLHTGLYCTRDYTYIAPRYGGCGRVGTALVTLKGRTIYGMREDYPDAPASVIAFIIPLRASVREATSVQRGRTARTIEARTIRSPA